MTPDDATPRAMTAEERVHMCARAISVTFGSNCNHAQVVTGGLNRASPWMLVVDAIRIAEAHAAAATTELRAELDRARAALKPQSYRHREDQKWWGEQLRHTFACFADLRRRAQIAAWLTNWADYERGQRDALRGQRDELRAQVEALQHERDELRALLQEVQFVTYVPHLVATVPQGWPARRDCALAKR
jgi:hypothetical protein